MWEVDPDLVSSDPEVRKKHWQRIALLTCETALEDRDCHLVYHYDLQKRILRLEKRLRVPRRLQHDFGHVKLREPEEDTVLGVQLVRDDLGVRSKDGRGLSTKTVWLDELGGSGEGGQPLQVSVEEMCLSYYRTQGWKGYHSEGGILRTLFAYLFFDVLFVYVPNVFQTAYQTCPLDLHTDAFYPARASQLNHRLVEIGNGEARRILREVYEREHERRTCVVGLNWDFNIEDLLELVTCFDGSALAAVCKVMAQEYKARGSGVPDLILWRASSGNELPDNSKNAGQHKGEVMFAEVKSANDRLSDTQRLWINVLTGAGYAVSHLRLPVEAMKIANSISQVLAVFSILRKTIRSPIISQTPLRSRRVLDSDWPQMQGADRIRESTSNISHVETRRRPKVPNIGDPENPMFRNLPATFETWTSAPAFRSVTSEGGQKEPLAVISAVLGSHITCVTPDPGDHRDVFWGHTLGELDVAASPTVWIGTSSPLHMFTIIFC